MNPYRDLPEGVTPAQCEKPNPRCESCGDGEASYVGGLCEACEEIATQGPFISIEAQHMAQTMDFVNRKLLGRKETQPIAKAVLEAKAMPQPALEAWMRNKIQDNDLLQKTQQLKDAEKPYQSVISAKLATIKNRAEFLRRFKLSRLDLECLGLAIDAITEQTAAAYEAMVWLDDNAPGKARDALRKGLGL